MGPQGPTGQSGVLAVFTVDGTPLQQSHVVAGSSTLINGQIQIQLQAGAVFSSAISYTCNATQTNGKQALRIVNQSGGQFLVASDDDPAAQFTFICTGN
jgi:hypothetical protein